MTIRPWFLLLCLTMPLSAQVMRVHCSDGTVSEFRVAEIDSITFGSSAGTLTWIGHASVKIKTADGVVIYIDPFASGDYKEPADVILVTHGHNDHNQISKVTKKAGCLIFSGPGASVGGQKMADGDSATLAGLTIHAVEAYNNNHPRGTGVGFVLSFNGVRVYHAGDTSKIAEMEALASMHIDYALLPIDGIYNMGPAEAAAAAEVIQAKKVIPIHVAPSNASAAEKQRNIDRFNAPNKLILKEGDTIYL